MIDAFHRASFVVASSIKTPRKARFFPAQPGSSSSYRIRQRRSAGVGSVVLAWSVALTLNTFLPGSSFR
jgi:hypothetical protein